MDTNGFRLKGEPDLTVQPSWYKVRKETEREIEATKTVNAPDSRYSAYAAPLEDGRPLLFRLGGVAPGCLGLVERLWRRRRVRA